MENVQNTEEKSLDQTLNIGDTIRLADGLEKKVLIGTIGLLHKVRGILAAEEWRFAFVIGRPKGEVDALKKDGEGLEKRKVDFPAVEAAYRKFFDEVLEGGLSDEEYFRVDPKGIEELDGLPARFL